MTRQQERAEQVADRLRRGLAAVPQQVAEGIAGAIRVLEPDRWLWSSLAWTLGLLLVATPLAIRRFRML